MRSEIETDRETGRGESGFIKCESKVSVEPSNVTIEDLRAFRKVLFGVEAPSDNTDLEWSYVRKDNIMIRTFKQAVTALGQVVEQQIKQTGKDIKKAKRVYYGR